MDMNILSYQDFQNTQKSLNQSEDLTQPFFGIEDIDEHIRRASGGRLIIIGGRPMQGKSYILDKILSNVAISNKSLFCSTIKSNVNIADRLQRIVKETPEAASNIFTFCSSDITCEQLIDNIRKAIEEKGIRYIFIDEIKYSFTNWGWNEWNLPKYTIHLLKKLALDYNVTIICTYITNWEAEERPGTDGKYPIMIGFEGITDFADIVIGVHRPTYYHILQDEYGESTSKTINVNIIKSPLIGQYTIKLKNTCSE